MSRLENAAYEVGAFVVIEGVCDTLNRTALMIDPDPSVVGVHRNVIPNGTELVIWGFQDGSTLDTMDTLFGRVGSVICLENDMLLLRQAMYAQGVEPYCAPTVDDRPRSTRPVGPADCWVQVLPSAG